MWLLSSRTPFRKLYIWCSKIKNQVFGPRREMPENQSWKSGCFVWGLYTHWCRYRLLCKNGTYLGGQRSSAFQNRVIDLIYICIFIEYMNTLITTYHSSRQTVIPESLTINNWRIVVCKHINEHWNNEHLKRLVYNTSLYLISRLGIILTTCLRAGTVWPILRRKWKTLLGSRVNTTGFQMPRKVLHRVQTHWDHFWTRGHFSLREPCHWFLIRLIYRE